MRRGELIFNLAVLMGPLVLGTCFVLGTYLSFNIPRATVWISSGLILVGFLSFFKAKMSVISKGQLLSFGTKNMTTPNKIAYFCGYVLMSLGALLMVIHGSSSALR